MATLRVNVPVEVTGLTQLDRLGGSLRSLGTTLTTSITLPVLAIGAAITKVGTDFDTTLRQIIALTDVTASEIDGVRSAVLRLSQQTGRAPAELAQGFYFLASAGLDTRQALDTLTIAAQASAAGLGSTDDIAKILASTLNAYGTANIDAAQAADILVAAVKDGTAESSAFAGVLGRVVPTAATLGVSFDQVTAALAAMTLSGLSADEAATSLNQVLVSLLNPSAEAEKALKGMGTSSAELRKELAEKGLLATLRDLETRFNGNDEAAAAVFGNVRALRGVLALLGLDTSQLSGIFKDTATATGSLGQAFSDTDGPGRDLAKTSAEIQVTLIELSTTVLPAVSEALAQVRDLIVDARTWWSGLDAGTQSAIVSATALAAVVGPLLVVLGSVIGAIVSIASAIGTVVGWIGVLVGWIGTLASAIATAVSAIAFVVGAPVAVVAAVIAAIIAAVVAVVLFHDQILAVASQLVAGIASFFGGLGAAIGSAFSSAAAVVGGVMATIGATVSAAWTAIVGAVTTAVNAILAVATTVWNAIRDVIRTVLTVILVAIVVGVTIWNDTIGRVLGAILAEVTRVWTQVSSFIGGILTTVGTAISTAWTGFATKVSAVLTTISTEVSRVWTAISSTIASILATIGAAISAAWTAATTVVTTNVNAARATVTSVWAQISSYVSSVVNAIRTAISDAFTAASGAVSSVMTTIKTNVASIWTAITNAFNTASAAIGRALDGIYSTFQRVFGGLAGVVKGPVNTVIGFLNTFIRYWDGLRLSIPSIDLGPLGTIGGYTLSLPYISPVPYLAKGVRDFIGGLAVVGEQGPELVSLPAGSDVYSRGDTSGIFDALASGKAGGMTIIGQQVASQTIQATSPDEVERQVQRGIRRATLAWSLQGG